MPASSTLALGETRGHQGTEHPSREARPACAGSAGKRGGLDGARSGEDTSLGFPCIGCTRQGELPDPGSVLDTILSLTPDWPGPPALSQRY